MFGLSFFEILFLAALALVVIGPKQLPEVARTLGRFVNELRRSTSVFTGDLRQSMREDQHRPKPSAPVIPSAPKEEAQHSSSDKKDPNHV